jgi:hypothetical protein
MEPLLMSAEVIVISPEFGSGGVGDYTLRVAEQWTALRPHFLVANPSQQSVEHDVEQLGSTLPSGGRILLQYSAYGFQRYGYPRKLLRALVDWKRETQGVLVIMFHEIWTFWPLLNKNRPLQWLHRRDIAALTRAADAVFTSTQSQAEHLRVASGPRSRRRAAGRIEHHTDSWPEGSQAERSRGPFWSAAVTSLDASQNARALKRARSSGLITKLIIVGGGNDRQGDAEERSSPGVCSSRDGVEIPRGACRSTLSQELLASASFAVSRRMISA